MRVVENDQSRTIRIARAELFELLGHQTPIVLGPRAKPSDRAPDDLSLWLIGHPRRRGNTEVPVIDELYQKHQLLGAGTDEHVVAGALDGVLAPMILRHRVAQFAKPLDREVVLLVGVLLQRFNDGARNGKRRLSEAEFDDVTALFDELGTELVDGEGRGRRESANIQVQVDGWVTCVACSVYLGCHGSRLAVFGHKRSRNDGSWRSFETSLGTIRAYKR